MLVITWKLTAHSHIVIFQNAFYLYFKTHACFAIQINTSVPYDNISNKKNAHGHCISNIDKIKYS
jgi:hypothetical protein